jgi:hypothetical protein
MNGLSPAVFFWLGFWFWLGHLGAALARFSPHQPLSVFFTFFFEERSVWHAAHTGFSFCPAKEKGEAAAWASELPRLLYHVPSAPWCGLFWHVARHKMTRLDFWTFPPVQDLVKARGLTGGHSHKGDKQGHRPRFGRPDHFGA